MRRFRKKSEPIGAQTHSPPVTTHPSIPLLVERYADRLYRAAAASCSPDEARDLCQQTFLIAARSTFEGRSAPYTWLYGIMKNLRREQRRKARRPLPASAPALSVATPESEMARSQIQARVRAAVAHLPETQRDAVILFYLEECPVAEVAERLGVPVGTVKSRLHAARAVLRRALKGDR